MLDGRDRRAVMKLLARRVIISPRLGVCRAAEALVTPQRAGSPDSRVR
jgi:hypothetical protein